MKLSEIDATLREIRVTPVKTLGQNFLHDRNLARWIVDKAQLSPQDYVVEIGPGRGALTELILDSGARLLAIEKDQRLVGFLRKRFGEARLEIVHGDALDFDLRPLFAQPRVKLLGNLPYYISSQLLLKFTIYPSPIQLSLLMLQKEMARRSSALPGTSDYGALSLHVQLQYRVEFLRTVPASVFLPQPDVEGNDCWPGDAPRDEVHGNNLRDRAVHVCILNRRGGLLLQERARWKDRHPLLWDSTAAGHVEAGEEYDQTAMRELREALGV